MRMNMMMMVMREVSNRLSCNNYSHGGKQSSCCSSNNDDNNNNNNNSRFLKYYYLMIIRLSPFLVVWSLVVITSILGLFILYCSPSATSLGLSWVSSSSSELTKRGVNQNQTNDHAAPAANPQQYPKKDGTKTCDLFQGHWVPDSNAPLYTPSACPTIPGSKNCFKNGRMDNDFLRWRWQPDDCRLPRFDPAAFLGLVAGKKMAFVGDSVARNQFESLICLLSQTETPKDIYKDSEDRFRTWLFPSSNFTLTVVWSKFLVKYEERMIEGKGSGAYNLHLDKVDDKWTSRINDVDYAIFSDAHWFFRKNHLYHHGKPIGCAYCDEPNVAELGLNHSLRTAFRAALKYINDCKECKETLVTLVRTFSPAHFENGAWDKGGGCNRTGPYDEGHMKARSWEMDLRALQMEEMERAREEGRGKAKRFVALDVTKAMLMRPDGHPGEFWGNKWMKGYSDCIHWCLPGPIDAWNEFLMAVLQQEGS